MQTLTRVANLILIMILFGMIMAMTACSKTDENGQTVGQKVDKVIDKTNEQAARTGKQLEQAASQAGDKIERGADKAQSEARTAMQDAAALAREKAREKAGEITSVVDDSAITASVKADILKDPRLSSLKVDVSTEKGEVTLTGKVDDQAAKERAGQVAAAVAGVHKVNNELQVAAGKAKGGSAAA
jgi:osmotically-inducible protein OsmY